MVVAKTCSKVSVNCDEHDINSKGAKNANSRRDNCSARGNWVFDGVSIGGGRLLRGDGHLRRRKNVG